MLIVKNYMSSTPIGVYPSTSFRNLAKMFKENNFDIFPVIDEERYLLGIVSRTDMLHIFLPQYFSLMDDFSYLKDFGALELDKEAIIMIERIYVADDLMTKEVITVTEDTSLMKSIALMRKYRVRSLPVINEENKLMGIITRTDILKAFL
ncbi:MAG: CBS domain-containing protein [bacterium]|nr:CBS domain-containing protein [bacterium]